MSERPFWFPVLCDDAYFARLREDYPHCAHMSDEDLHDHFNEGLKYQNLWDHAGDAYSDYEPLADSYLTVLSLLKEARKCMYDWDDKEYVARVDAAIAAAEGS